MDVEKCLISKLEDKESLLVLLEERVSEDFFVEYRSVYAAILDHYKKYGIVPDRGVVQQAFPNFEFEDSSQPIRFFVDKIKELQKQRLYKTGLSKVVKLVSSDIDAAERELQKLIILSKRTIKTGTDLDLRSIGTRVEEYQMKKQGGGYSGYTCGWEIIDDLTTGYQPGDLWITVAEPKKKKSWLLVEQAHHVWKNERVPVLILTREMSPQALRRRFDAIECGLPWDPFRKGLLSAPQEEWYLSQLEEMEKDEIPIVVLGYSLGENIATVSSLIPKVETHLANGGVLFIDGLYLLNDDRGEQDWKGIVNIARDLKDMAQTYRLPIITTSQARMEGKNYIPNMENIAYGKYIAQYADAIFSISETPRDREAQMLWLHLIAQREGDVGQCLLNANFNTMDFSQKNINTVDNYVEIGMGAS